MILIAMTMIITMTTTSTKVITTAVMMKMIAMETMRKMIITTTMVVTMIAMTVTRIVMTLTVATTTRRSKALNHHLCPSGRRAHVRRKARISAHRRLSLRFVTSFALLPPESEPVYEMGTILYFYVLLYLFFSCRVIR